MDHEKKSSSHSVKHENSVEQFLNRLRSDLRPGQPGDESIAAAVEAIQRFALETDSEIGSQITSSNTCRACGSSNREGNRFCSNCGVPLMPSAVEEKVTTPDQSPLPGEHHYHHHYHHHYFLSDGVSQPAPVASVPASTHDSRMRPPLSGASLTRAESAVRKLTHDWGVACNGKHLDDLVSLYIPDGLILRANIPPVRGTSAIREFFFSVLDAGMGDVELEPLRLEVFGEIAYEAGRFSMLVPVAMGKRREERGKYLILTARQAGDWKIVADCWSSDLNLAPASEIVISPTSPAGHPVRPQRKL